MSSQQIGDRIGITRLEQAAFILQDEPIGILIGREDGWFAEDVGSENRAVAGDPIINKGFGVFSLVSRDELKSLSEEGKAEITGGQAGVAAADVARIEEVDEERKGGGKEEKRCKGIHGRPGI
jgi:hypothetical protein